MDKVRVRKIAAGEEIALWSIYYGAIHNVCTHDYSDEQINAWAPADFDKRVWESSIKKLNPWVAVIGSDLVGYTDLQSDGLIDHFFVDHRVQRCGVGQSLMNTVLGNARDSEISRLYSHVSRTARPFYEHNGFTVIGENRPVIRGVALINYTMEINLPGCG